MKAVVPVTATNSATDRTFNLGVAAVVLATLGSVALLYHAAVLSLTEFVVWGVLGVPAVALVASIGLAKWLGYAAEAKHRSMRYSMWLNHGPEE